MYATSTGLVFAVIVCLRVSSGTYIPSHGKQTKPSRAQHGSVRESLLKNAREISSTRKQFVSGGNSALSVGKAVLANFNSNAWQSQRRNLRGNFRYGLLETIAPINNKRSVASATYSLKHGQRAFSPTNASKLQSQRENLRGTLRKTPAYNGNLSMTKKIATASNKSFGFPINEANKESPSNNGVAKDRHVVVRESDKSKVPSYAVNDRNSFVASKYGQPKARNMANGTSSIKKFLPVQSNLPDFANTINTSENISVMPHKKSSNVFSMNYTGNHGMDQGLVSSRGIFVKVNYKRTQNHRLLLGSNKLKSKMNILSSKVSQATYFHGHANSKSDVMTRNDKAVKKAPSTNRSPLKHGHHHHIRHHHHHHHHHRRHHHHHSTHHSSERKEKNQQQVQTSKGDQYKVSPPTMIRERPQGSKKQQEIFKSPKKIAYAEDYKQAPSQKRFVIIGGPRGVHSMKRFHFTPALLSALKLVLNKENTFKKDADILNLAEALQTKDADTNIAKNNSITTAVSSGLTRNGQRARLVTVKDPGYINHDVTKVGNMKAMGHPRLNSNKEPSQGKSDVHLEKQTNVQYPEHVKEPFLKAIIQRIRTFQEGNKRKGIHGDIQGIAPLHRTPEVLGEPAYRSSISEDHSHSALVNPTSLGISILKLLFGKRAKLIVKPKYKLLINDRPGAKFLQGFGTRKQRAELQKEIEDENKLILLKGTRKEKFEATLAKSISNLITAMNKNDIAAAEAAEARAKLLTTQNDTSSQQNPVREENGTRKSWVLLKMPKAGEKEDEKNVQKYEDNEDVAKQAIKLIATVGKQNNEVSDERISKAKNIDDYVPDLPKKTKPIASDTASKSIPQISYNLNGIKTKNELGKIPSSSSSYDSQSMGTTLGKILRGIQESIKELKNQRREDDEASSNRKLAALTSTDTSPISFKSTGISEAGDVAKIPDLLAAVNKLLGATARKSHAMPGVPSDQTGSEASTISVPTVDEQSDAARRYVSAVRASTDPLLPKPTYDEPITVTGHSREHQGPNPNDNVLFESDEMAAQRDSANTLEAMKLQEDLETFAEKALNTHNKYRALHHSPDLKWSDELATQAEKIAYDMAMKGKIEKSALATTLNYGENVAKISGTTFDRAGEEATNLWYAEISNYSFSDPRISPQTDSFTQVVWRSSRKLGMGCARDLQTNDLYVVALYDPKGNDEPGLRSNVINKGGVTEDVYASIFKRHRIKG